MKIFITGACGFIGSHLVELLVKRGHHVKALSFYNHQNSYGWLDQINNDIKKKIEIISGDIRDYNFLLKETKNIDVIFNLAALISIPYSYISPSSYVQTNIIGSQNILEASRLNKIKKTIIVSTSEVYGSAKYVPIDENHPLNAQSPYAATKIAADQLALSYFRSFDLPVSILRPFNTFGPRQSAKAIIPSILIQLLRGAKEIKLGNLTPKRDLTYIEDTTNAFLSILDTKKNIMGEVINIGSGYEISIIKIIDILKKDFGFKFDIITDKKRIRPCKSEVMRLLAKNTKAKNILNWKPNYNSLNGFKISLEKTINWFKREENLNSYKYDKYNI
jgi:NAD dependent epimerase/dehydratase